MNWYNRFFRNEEPSPLPPPPKPPKPPTRAAVMLGLFKQWGNAPFSCGELVGVSSLKGMNSSLPFYWIYWEGGIEISHNNTVVLHIEPDARATIYDDTFSDRLNDYIVALRLAIKDRDDAIKAKRIKEETQF